MLMATALCRWLNRYLNGGVEFLSWVTAEVMTRASSRAGLCGHGGLQSAAPGADQRWITDLDAWETNGA